MNSNFSLYFFNMKGNEEHSRRQRYFFNFLEHHYIHFKKVLILTTAIHPTFIKHHKLKYRKKGESVRKRDMKMKYLFNQLKSLKLTKL